MAPAGLGALPGRCRRVGELAAAGGIADVRQKAVSGSAASVYGVTQRERLQRPRRTCAVYIGL